MICYKDMAFCEKDSCVNWQSCHRALTEEVKQAAIAWWGNDCAPISIMHDPDCYVAVVKDEPILLETSLLDMVTTSSGRISKKLFVKTISKEFDSLKALLKKAEEVLAFYANPDNWTRRESIFHECIDRDDCKNYPHVTRDMRFTGGHRAREYFKQGEINESSDNKIR